MERLLSTALASAFCLLAAACEPIDSTSSSSSSSPSGCEADAGAFLPFANAFTGYHGWTSFHLTHGTMDDGVHDVNAPLTAYLNQRPPPGADSFPMGTIIVKEVEQGPIDTRKVFAIVKRCGDFNPSGAVNWEWFELVRNTGSGDTVRIVWRGVGPPKGEMYGGNAKGACNGCHVGAKNNDYIWSAPLQIEALAQ